MSALSCSVPAGGLRNFPQDSRHAASSKRKYQIRSTVSIVLRPEAVHQRRTKGEQPIQDWAMHNAALRPAMQGLATHTLCGKLLLAMHEWV